MPTPRTRSTSGPQVTASVSSNHTILPERDDMGNYRVPPRELRRIKEAVRNIHEQDDLPKVVGIGFGFLVPPFILAAYLWPSAYAALPDAAKPEFAGVATNLWVMSGACVLIAIAFLIGYIRSGHTERVGKNAAISLIENIEDRFDVPE